MAAVIFLNKISGILSKTAETMDEENGFRATLNAQSAEVKSIQNSILKMSSQPINHGYTLRMIDRFIRNIRKGVTKGAQLIVEEYKKFRENVQIDPFDVWDSSGDKSQIAVSLESDYDDPIILGDIFMDLDAPCNVMRTYIHKSFRSELNDTVGDSFLFFGSSDGKEVIIDRENEPSTDAKEIIKVTENEINGEKTYAIRIMRDKSVEVVQIPEFKESETTQLPPPVQLDHSVSMHDI
jgi:hypothetical protein